MIVFFGKRIDSETLGRSLNSDFKHMFGASEKEKVGNWCSFASHCCTFSRRKEKNELRKVSQRKEEEKGQKKTVKREERRQKKDILAQTLNRTHPTHLRRLLTHRFDGKREGRGNEREGRLSPAHIQHELKRFRRQKREGEGAAENGKIFLAEFQFTPRLTPPPHPAPTDSTRLNLLKKDESSFLNGEKWNNVELQTYWFDAWRHRF